MSFLDRFRSKQPPAPEARDLLFGDLPLSQWASADMPAAHAEPWASFIAADEMMSRDRAAAVARLRTVTEMQGLESRHYLEAWHVLRSLDVQPPAGKAKQLLGVVIEVQIASGVDYLAAYADHSARYFNHAGRAIIWERPDATLDRGIDAVFQIGQVILDAIGPWENPRPAPPGRGEARINLLAPSGLHFGQGPFDALSRDPLAGRALNAGAALMAAMMRLTGAK